MARATAQSPSPKKASSLSPPLRVPVELDDGRRIAVGERIGKGADATVYRAVVNGAGGIRRLVALKLFDDIGLEEREQVMPILARAIRRAARIRHPNVAEVYDLGYHGTQPFTITEFVEGASLAKLIDSYVSRGQKVPPDLALFISIEVAEALNAAARCSREPANHAHGDLSAREILLSHHGEVKVTDFGLRIAPSAASGARRHSSIASRGLTLSPEVAQGDEPDMRADIFALGALLRFMLTGDRFPEGLSDDGILSLIVEGAFAPRLFGPRLAPGLEDLLERATRADPDRRIGDLGLFAYELRRAAMALGVGDGRIFLRNALAARIASPDDVDLDGPTLRMELPVDR